ncbi:MAG: hypothetical protein QUV05_07870 [Phycisphaerae bacterium]|nr:hypothetical protein [Phycisphaerae bacterium]
MKDLASRKIEELFRYALTGGLLFVLVVAKRPELVEKVKEVSPVYAMVMVIAVGMAIYGIYRVVLWVTLERLLYWLNASAPSTYRQPHEGRWCRFSACNGRFLETRFTEEAIKRFDYLYHRWAITHFALLSAVLFLCVHFCVAASPPAAATAPAAAGSPIPSTQAGTDASAASKTIEDFRSWLYRKWGVFCWTAVGLFSLAAIQLIQLYLTEKELFSKGNSNKFLPRA